MFEDSIRNYFIKKHDFVVMSKNIPNGSLTAGDVEALLEYSFNKDRILELGTAGGASAAIMSLNSNGFIITVDLFEDIDKIENERSREHYREFLQKSGHTLGQVKLNLSQFKKIYIEQGLTYEIAERYPDNFFELIFIDADHSCEGFKKDFLVAKRKIKDRGILLLHDCVEGYGVWNYFRNYIDRDKTFIKLNPDRDITLTSMMALGVNK